MRNRDKIRVKKLYQNEYGMKLTDLAQQKTGILDKIGVNLHGEKFNDFVSAGEKTHE